MTLVGKEANSAGNQLPRTDSQATVSEWATSCGNPSGTEQLGPSTQDSPAQGSARMVGRNPSAGFGTCGRKTGALPGQDYLNVECTAVELTVEC